VKGKEVVVEIHGVGGDREHPQIDDMRKGIGVLGEEDQTRCIQKRQSQPIAHGDLAAERCGENGAKMTQAARRNVSLLNMIG